MARGLKVMVLGIPDIDRKLRALPLNLQKKVIRPAMRGALRPVAAAVKAQSPVDTGAMRLAVKIGAPRKRRRDVITYEVRVRAEGHLRKTSGRTGKTVFYPAIVEYRFDPFMMRALAESGITAREMAISRIRAGLDREIKGK